MLYLRWLPVGSCTLLQRGNGWIPLPLFSVCACGAISSDPDPNLKERGIFTRMGWGLTDYIRISLGSKEENDWLIEEIRLWLDLKKG